jgi:hypothetical protein
VALLQGCTEEEALKFIKPIKDFSSCSFGTHSGEAVKTLELHRKKRDNTFYMRTNSFD